MAADVSQLDNDWLKAAAPANISEVGDAVDNEMVQKLIKFDRSIEHAAHPGRRACNPIVEGLVEINCQKECRVKVANLVYTPVADDGPV